MYQIDLSALDESTAHTLDLWSSLATRWQCLNVTIYVTYEYVVVGTTRILNYLELPLEYETPLNGTSANERHRQTRTVIIAEPGSIINHNVSVNFQFQNNASATLQVRAGSQVSFRGYAHIGNLMGGMFEDTHLLDSRSSAGTAITLTNGKNDLVIDTYRSTGGVTNLSGLIRILYESDVPVSGIDSAVKCCYRFVRQMDYTATGDNTVSNVSFAIPEADYWLTGIGVQLNMYAAAASGCINVWAEVNSGEADGDGWKALYTDPFLIDAELNFAKVFVRGRDAFKRHPDDADSSRLDLESNRRFRVACTGTTIRMGWKLIVNYHSQIFAVSGNITNSDGGTVNLHLFTADTHELYSVSSRVGDGSYSFNVHDPIQQYYVVAYEDGNYLGRSANGTGT